MAGNGDRDYRRRRGPLAWKGVVSEHGHGSCIAAPRGASGLAGDSAAARWAGDRIPPVEDERMITGHGRSVDDLHKPGTVPAAFVRSTVARVPVVRNEAQQAFAGELRAFLDEHMTGKVKAQRHEHAGGLVRNADQAPRRLTSILGLLLGA
jgi:hypothetical protein